MRASTIGSILLTIGALLGGCSAGEDGTSESEVNARRACNGLTAEGVSEQVRTFMGTNGMIGAQDEQDLPDIGIHQRWRAVSLVPAATQCLVAMNVVMRIDGRDGA